MWTLPEQGYEGLTHAPRAKGVRVQRLLDDLQIGRQSILPGIVQDSRVVDQDIQTPIRRCHMLPESLNTYAVSHIELVSQHGQMRLG
jgi:hypothetical protein